MTLVVQPIDAALAKQVVVDKHYLHRRPACSFSFGLFNGELRGVVTFGIPASRHLQISACRDEPNSVLELNRLWVDDEMPRNTESWFIARALALLPPRIIVSYADTAQGHSGFVYRASNFNYAGYTDMERKTPRFDYVTDGKHSRASFRGGAGLSSTRVRRKPKMKYWIITGNKREQRRLARLCCWPKLDWRTVTP